ncbi:hypothetical protein ARSEF4850_007638 [Beauveria asiatica]
MQDLAAASPLLLRTAFEIEIRSVSSQNQSRPEAEAAVHMGLPNSDDQDVEELNKRFSDDILWIEISGPDQHHLSVVDVPGLFHNLTKYQTREDLSVIRGLIETYTRDARTIILAVMDARNDLANQEVFKMARAADPAGIRTVGIMTKCDALQPGDEQVILRIAQNTVERLQHGWFVIRNRSTQEIQEGVTIAQRHENERRFFQGAPWSELPKERIGVKALKPFLGQLLYEHIRREFPALVKEIEALYKETQRRRNVEDALKGNYEEELDPESRLKLRMHLRDLADTFEKNLRTEGYKLPFEQANGAIDAEFLQLDEDVEAPDIMRWIRKEYREARNWGQIASNYLEKVMGLITDYTKLECRRVEDDETIRSCLESLILSRLDETNNRAQKRLEDLLKDERGGVLQTVNHYFAVTLEKIRKDRLLTRLSGLNLQGDGWACATDPAKLTDMLHISNEDQAAMDLHDE